MDSKFHLDLSNIPLTDFQTISDEEPLSDANVTSGYDKTESCTEYDSSEAAPGPTYGQGRMKKTEKKKKALNKSYTSPTVARKLKELEDDVDFITPF